MNPLDPTPPTGLNLPGMQAATRRMGRILRRATPPLRLPQNRQVIVRNILQMANGMFRKPTVPMELDVPFDPSALGLKEIGNLASWTVSSCKPGCGVEALRDEDTGLFWQ